MVRARHAPSLRGYAYQILAATTWVAMPWLPFVRARTLLLFGDDDPIVHTVNGRVLAHLLPDATLRVVPGGGHLFLIDQPQEAGRIVAAFLNAPDR